MGISLATGKCSENVSIFDCVTSSRIGTRGEGEAAEIGLKSKTWYVISGCVTVTQQLSL